MFFLEENQRSYDFKALDKGVIKVESFAWLSRKLCHGQCYTKLPKNKKVVQANNVIPWHLQSYCEYVGSFEKVTNDFHLLEPPSSGKDR